MKLGGLEPEAPGLETRLEYVRISLLLFGEEPEKRPKEGQHIQHPISYFVRFQLREDLRAHGAKALLVVLISMNENRF